MQTYMVVMLGGAIGSGLRFWLASLIGAKYGESFPTGTLVVNVAGCLVIGLFVALTGTQGTLGASLLTRQFVTVGILGGFTTFSSFGLQTFDLAAKGEWFRAGLYAFLSFALCLGAVWAGHGLGKLPAG